MSERTSSILVGAFVVGALLIATVAGLFFAGGGFGADRSRVVMIFDGSLRGLTVGAPVALRGVTIGQVTNIDLLLNTDAGEVTMAVVAEIDPRSVRRTGRATENIAEELVAQGLRAQLNTQSLLTGLLYVQLDFHPDNEGKMVAFDSPYPQIPTIPTEFEQLRQSLESIDYSSIVDDINRIATGLDSLLNSEDMQALPGTLRTTLLAVESASSTLTATVEANSLALESLLTKSGDAVATINDQLPQISAAVSTSLQHFDEALSAANTSLERIEQAAAPDSPPRRQLSQAIHELSLTARALRSLARTLEEHPESLLRGRSGEPQ